MESYALVVMPEKEIADVINVFRQRFSEYASHTMPPHVTIYPPFYSQFPTIGDLRQVVAESCALTPPQRISLHGIGAFGGESNIVYLEPDHHSRRYLLDLFQKVAPRLQDSVTAVHKNSFGYTDGNFTPHLTLAENVPSEKLSAVMSKLSAEDIKLSFLVNALSLFQKEEGSNFWRLLTGIKFGSSTPLL